MEFRLYFEERLSGKGEWIKFPLTVSEFEGRIRCICKGAPVGADHFMDIVDVEGPEGIPDYTVEPFNFEEVNELARNIEDIDESDWEVVECLVENGRTLEEATSIVDYSDFVDLRDCSDDEDLVRGVTDHNELIDLQNLPDYILDNIDWSAAASDLLDNYEIYPCGGGYVMIQ